MQPKDKILFYSSKEKFSSSKPYQKFTAAGKVKDKPVYRVQMKPGFEPYRRKIEFYSCREVNIHSLLEKLDFVENTKKWGYKLMNGFLEIDRHDFELVFNKMRREVTRE